MPLARGWRGSPRRAAAPPDRSRAADTAYVPAVGAAARVDEELDPPAGADRLHRRLAVIWRTVIPALPRTWPGTGGSTAGALPTLPERSRTAHDDHVGAGRRGRAADAPVPDASPAALAAREARDLLGRADVGAQDAEARRAAAPDAAGADLECARHRPGDRRGDRQHDRPRRGRVDVERAGRRSPSGRCGAARSASGEAVGRAQRRVGAAVPDHAHGACGRASIPSARRRTRSPSRLTIVTVNASGLLDLEGDPVDVAAAVPVGREEALDAA